MNKEKFDESQIKILFMAAQAVCEHCAKFKGFVDDKKQTHYDVNAIGIKHMTPCKAAGIYRLINEN